MLRAGLAALLVCVSFSASAETFKSEDELRQFTDRVVDFLLKEGTAAAFVAMKPYTLMPEAELEAFAAAVTSQCDQFRARAG